MALKNTRKTNYPEWYQNVIQASDMAEISASPGCMVIKPWGYGIWERIQRLLDDRFKATGHENCYFPLFIPLSFFQKEADHVEGFAKEMAVVTHSRLTQQDGKLVPASPLEEPLVVRPTSETIIADAFSKWIESYRDLPVLVNQWANVVRWEMRPRIFLRTREFLWQEGHTAHASYEEAEEETKKMLGVYAEFVENCMAMPVLQGRKPEHEKFPGAIDTYCIEAMMQDGRALQAGTSHFLGQNFAKSADIKFQSAEGKLEYAYTTSWGVSTRLIGGLIMTHADDEGMVVPPALAPYQIVIVPIIKNKDKKGEILEYAQKIYDLLKDKTFMGERVRVRLDDRAKESVDKNWEWIRKGAPIICEVGPRDIEKQGAMIKTRIHFGTPEGKQIVSIDDFAANIEERLAGIQKAMFDKANNQLQTHISTDITTPEQLEEYFTAQNAWLEDNPNPVCFVRGKWSGDPATEEKMKAMRITIRCIPFDQSGTEGVCLLSGKPATMDVVYARSY